MSVRTIPRERLAAALPPVTTSQTLLALVPVTSDATWAAETAWSIARAAATGGRQVILVDLCFDEPVLHRPVGDSVDNGIVDAFEYGVSLSYVSRSHLNRTLFFIPTGSAAGDPGRILESTRWTKLARGLGATGALLLLYLTPSSLARLGASADGVVVLAPQGFDPEATPIPKLDAVLDGGVPLLAVVCEGVGPAVEAAATPTASERRSATMKARGRTEKRRRVAPWIVAALIPVAGVAGVLAVRGCAETGPTVAESDTAAVAQPRTVPEQPSPQPAQPEPEPPAAPSPLPFATATPFVVQVAAYDAADQASARADRLRSPNRAAFVTVLELGSLGTWHRVYLGPYASAQEAVDARAALWAARSVRRGEGMVRRAPYALEVPAELRGDVERLGLVPYVVEDRVLVGAFESPQQTTVTAEQLTQAGIPFTLVERAEPSQ